MITTGPPPKFHDGRDILVGAEGTQPQDQQPELAYEDPRFSQMWLVLERPTSMDRVAPPTG